MSNVKIRLKGVGKSVNLPLGSSLKDLYRISGLQMKYAPVCARVNNKVQGMNYRFYNAKDVEFLDLTSGSGMRTYTRSLFFILSKAVKEIFPDSNFYIEAPACRGYYCELHIGRKILQEDVDAIKQRMHSIIERNLPFHRIQCPVEEAIELFRSHGMESKAKLLESQRNLYTFYYELDGSVDYYYSCLLTNTGEVTVFDLMLLGDGLLLRIPSRNNPQELEPLEPQQKMIEVIREFHHWKNILGLRTAGDVNEAVMKGRASEIINVSEALQERKLAGIADEIVSKNRKLVLIAGPSSSGKTTTSKRLAILLMTYGKKPHTISIDNYFVNRVDTPTDETGAYDFECIGSVDTDFFNLQMKELLEGKEVELPRYDFVKGERVFEGNTLKIGDEDIIILEGNHALNPIMSQQVEDEKKYRIFVSALTTIQLDDHNLIPTDDIRLLRRVVRDFKYRGYSGLDTVRRYPSVQRGEDKWIFPFQELADATFNSALLYELGVIKQQAMPILEQIPETVVEYAEATRLRKFLRYFASIPAEQVPPASLLREFAGGSNFDY